VCASLKYAVSGIVHQPREYVFDASLICVFVYICRMYVPTRGRYNDEKTASFSYREASKVNLHVGRARVTLSKLDLWRVKCVGIRMQTFSAV